MSDDPASNTCLACHRRSDETPLIPLDYRGARLSICPQAGLLQHYRPGKL
jgi:hypothetical protein